MRRRKPHRQSFSKKFFPNRLLAAQIGAGILFGIILFRIFELQVVSGEAYYERALRQRNGLIEIPARRGEILVRDQNTNTLVKLATNTTLDLVYVDPKVTPDKKLVAKTLAPLLYTNEDHEACLKNPKLCPEGSVRIVEQDAPKEGDSKNYRPPEVVFPTKDEAVAAYALEIFRRINREKVDFVLLGRDVSDETLESIEKFGFPGIDIARETFLVYADPTKVPQGKQDRMKIASALSPLLNVPTENIENLLQQKDLRYVRLKNKIRPEVSEKIQEIKTASYETYQQSKAEILAKKLDKDPIPDYFRGVVLVPEHWRYYPENTLASQVIGFVNREGTGQYGIEGKFHRLLSGKTGSIRSENDVSGKSVDPTSIKNAEDGVSFVLTLDRVIQKKVEEVLEESTKKFKADSGQIIVMEPKTGRILALANAPSFNPNEYADALTLRRTGPDDTKTIFKTTPLFRKDKFGRYQPATFEEFEEAWKLEFDPEFYIYENGLGPGAFVNRTIQEVYEPGSVFKPLIMAAGIESGEVTPTTTFLEDGPVQVGSFTIRTALDKYNGIQTMTNVLETSSNVGMVFVALRLGKAVMHSFITDKYNFGDYTDIELDQEEQGKVLPRKDWSDAHLLTASFGQGLTVTPLQMARAWSALANGGVMMQPQIISEKDYPDGTKEIIEPAAVRRAISTDTATTITSMLVSSVERGVAHTAHIPGYKIAGKTGTSQIAGSDGKYETGEGSFVTSFAGYAPAYDPRFLILVKFDRPRYGTENTWGATTAAPVFREIMAFLLEYGNIPPEE
ncbi:penicillin-binding protein 2 [Candidatus Peregrinibacteria bacterium]|nr:MAG: penicillin-binding protein 2 [Candidatus Peregrinibacteria bacterium]